MNGMFLILSTAMVFKVGPDLPRGATNCFRVGSMNGGEKGDHIEQSNVCDLVKVV